MLRDRAPTAECGGASGWEECSISITVPPSGRPQQSWSTFRTVRARAVESDWLRVPSKTGTIEALMQMAARCSPIRHEAEDLVHDVLARRDRERPRLRRFKGSRKGHPGQNGPVAIWLLAPSPKSLAGSRFFVLYRKTAWKSATQERAAFWAAITSMENAS